MSKLLFISAIIICFIVLALTFSKKSIARPSQANEDVINTKKISPEQALEIRDEYYNRVKNRRLAEADIFWQQMLSKGGSERTNILIDFRFNSTEASNAELLVEQLSENHSMSARFEEEHKSYVIGGTTRPEELNLNRAQFLKWVEFMSDVSAQYNCIFLNWTFESSEPEMFLQSESIETNLP